MITVTLTTEEVRERSQALAEYANKLAELADEEEGAKARHKQLMADIKERRLDISNELRRLSRAVRLGVEERAEQQVFWEEEQRLAEFRREREIERGEELIERQQQAEMEQEAERERLHSEAVATWRRQRLASDETEKEEDYQAEWFAALTSEEKEKYYAAPCKCGHSRDWHGEEGKDICERGCGVCDCKQYHCPACDTKGGHQATCEHYILGEGTPVEQAAVAQVIKLDDFTAPRCDECKRTDGGHTKECSKSNALRFDDYLAYARAHYKSNHQSHARKMELSKLKDGEIWMWKQQQAGNGVEAEPKKKKREKLSPVEAAIDR